MYPGILPEKLKEKDFLFLKKHEAAGNPVVEPLAFLGEPDHQEADEDDQGGDEFCKVPKRDAGKCRVCSLHRSVTTMRISNFPGVAWLREDSNPAKYNHGMTMRTMPYAATMDPIRPQMSLRW